MKINAAFIISVFITLLGSASLAYQTYKMVELDAGCRGIRHPGFWGAFAISGNNSSGLVFYMLNRRKYPLRMSEEQKEEMERKKKKALVSTVFLVAGAILVLYFLVFGA
ncbi:MAG: hypothetical protein ACI4DQ_02650 [Lachnospiraceae bacterium]